MQLRLSTPRRFVLLRLPNSTAHIERHCAVVLRLDTDVWWLMFSKLNLLAGVFVTLACIILYFI